MNLRPPACKADALPTELPALLYALPLAGRHSSVKGILPNASSLLSVAFLREINIAWQTKRSRCQTAKDTKKNSIKLFVVLLLFVVQNQIEHKRVLLSMGLTTDHRQLTTNT